MLQQSTIVNYLNRKVRQGLELYLRTLRLIVDHTLYVIYFIAIDYFSASSSLFNYQLLIGSLAVLATSNRPGK